MSIASGVVAVGVAVVCEGRESPRSAVVCGVVVRDGIADSGAWRESASEMEGGVSVRVGGGGGRYTAVAAATGRERGSMSFGGARAVRDDVRTLTLAAVEILYPGT